MRSIDHGDGVCLMLGAATIVVVVAVVSLAYNARLCCVEWSYNIADGSGCSMVCQAINKEVKKRPTD